MLWPIITTGLSGILASNLYRIVSFELDRLERGHDLIELNQYFLESNFPSARLSALTRTGEAFKYQKALSYYTKGSSLVGSIYGEFDTAATMLQI